MVCTGILVSTTSSSSVQECSVRPTSAEPLINCRVVFLPRMPFAASLAITLIRCPPVPVRAVAERTWTEGERRGSEIAITCVPAGAFAEALPIATIVFGSSPARTVTRLPRRARRSRLTFAARSKSGSPGAGSRISMGTGTDRRTVNGGSMTPAAAIKTAVALSAVVIAGNARPTLAAAAMREPKEMCEGAGRGPLRGEPWRTHRRVSIALLQGG